MDAFPDVRIVAVESGRAEHEESELPFGNGSGWGDEVLERGGASEGGGELGYGGGETFDAYDRDPFQAQDAELSPSESDMGRALLSTADGKFGSVADSVGPNADASEDEDAAAAADAVELQVRPMHFW